MVSHDTDIQIFQERAAHSIDVFVVFACPDSFPRYYVIKQRDCCVVLVSRMLGSPLAILGSADLGGQRAAEKSKNAKHHLFYNIIMQQMVPDIRTIRKHLWGEPGG